MRKQRRRKLVLPKWRNRLEAYFNFIENLQLELERTIGFGKRKYARYFAVQFDPIDIENIELLESLIKQAMPDLMKIKFTKEVTFLGVTIQGQISGERPKFKRVYYPEGKK
jgi:hypothetical protein